MSDWYETPFGPNGKVVYERTYSRPKPDGTNETWPETVSRVARGNIELVAGPQSDWTQADWDEYEKLTTYMLPFDIIPAGRHLWASGVKGRQYLMNCWVSGWGERISDHFSYTFLRLMEGGGVGSNYSARYLEKYGAPKQNLKVHIVCDPSHPDYEQMKADGLLSNAYSSDWDGAFEIGDSREGWAEALTDLIDTFWSENVEHENRVYDVTNVRAAGSRLKTFGGTASGPGPLAAMLSDVANTLNISHIIGHFSGLTAMDIDHAIAQCVVSGGVRRSARMAIMSWRDLVIAAFIGCKADTGKHWTTNISVEIDDEFLDAIDDETHEMHEWAKMVHELVVDGMLSNGEPGYWNKSLSQQGEVADVFATNPCGEITLTVDPVTGAGEPCNLGHVNMANFVEENGEVDWVRLIEAHRLVTRFLIRATHGDINDPSSRVLQDRMRRIGVGHLGVQDYLAFQGIPYSEAFLPGTEFAGEIQRLKMIVRAEARAYSFELRIPEPVKVTTVAPTGSISKLPGVGGEGIHPIYARYFEQRIRFNKNDVEQMRTVVEAEANGLKVESCQYDASGNTLIVVYPSKNRLLEQVEARGIDPDVVQSADQITVNEMLAFQSMYQTYWADNAVSYTVNVPEGLDREVLSDALLDYLPSLKGTTIMVDGTRPQAPFTRITREEYEAATGVPVISDGIDMDCSTGACPIR